MRRRCADEAEAALAALVARDGGEEVALGEVGPEHVGEVQLGVREAVEEEVRDAPLAAGADDEIRIAHGEAGHVGAERVGRHVVEADAARGDGLGELARRVRNLFAAAVREREREGHLPVLLALAAERVEDGAHQGGEPPEVADGVEANAVVEDLVALVEEEVAQELHERVDLLLGARPVLLAEGVEGERAQAEAACDAHGSPDGGGALPVPGRPRLAARLRPAAVAIHDDTDVPGEIAGFDVVHARVNAR